MAHRRLIEGKRELPVDLHGKAILHAGPIVRPSETAASGYEMVSVGPTTSMRMEKFEKEFVEQTGVKVIVGKGGMGPNTEYACKTFKAIHCVFPAGCAVVAATEVQRIAAHHWDELGMPETLWCPAISTIFNTYPSSFAEPGCFMWFDPPVIRAFHWQTPAARRGHMRSIRRRRRRIGGNRRSIAPYRF